jgi:AmmeMemoRadiSam system protein B
VSAGEESIRPPAVAGTFYPAEPAALRSTIARSFAMAARKPAAKPAPKALVVPHAGYVYSGPIAASAYLRVEPARDSIRRVVLLGPNHHVPVRGVALSSADAWLTPLGTVPVDDEHRSTLQRFGWVTTDDVAHGPEHCLEVQLPFLQTVLADFELVPLLVGESSPAEVSAVIDALWGGPETLVVVSTDLSHYHAYSDAAEVDSRTAAAITSLRLDDIDYQDACGSRPLRGLLHTAAGRGMTVRELDLRNSGDTAGDKRRVVGYGAFAVV